MEIFQLIKAIGFFIIISMPLFRTLIFIYYEYVWKNNKQLYENILIEIFKKINPHENLVQMIGDLIDPISGIGVEDLWIYRIGNIKVKNNEALDEIIKSVGITNILAQVLDEYESQRPSKLVVIYHLKVLLIQGWRTPSKPSKKYTEVIEFVYPLIRSLKYIAKKNLMKLTEKESRESIQFKFGVVFYRKYTYNLYKRAYIIGLIFIVLNFMIWAFPIGFFLSILTIPICLNLIKQQQPYFKSFEELIKDLNESNNLPPITIDHFEIGKVSYGDSTPVAEEMENNTNYMDGKLSRSIMWSVIFLFFGSLFSLLFIDSFNNSNDTSSEKFDILFLFFGIFFITISIRYIRLYLKLRSITPRNLSKSVNDGD
jgi:hypothetical protein